MNEPRTTTPTYTAEWLRRAVMTDLAKNPSLRELQQAESAEFAVLVDLAIASTLLNMERVVAKTSGMRRLTQESPESMLRLFSDALVTTASALIPDDLAKAHGDGPR